MSSRVTTPIGRGPDRLPRPRVSERNDVDAQTVDPLAAAMFDGVRRRFLLGLAVLLPGMLVLYLLVGIAEILIGSSGPLAWVAQQATDDPVSWMFGAFILGIVVVFGLGWLADSMVGRRIERLPIFRFVYGAQRQLLATLREQDPDRHPVVLVDSHLDHLKSVGIVTETLKDAASGETLVAVYILGSPNPVSGRVHIISLDRVTRTEWTPSEAMRFVASGGAIAPEKVHYDVSAKAKGSGRPADAAR